MRKFLKITAWTLMALILSVLASLICVVKLLSPDQLTAIANHAANQVLNARVEIGRVELDFTSHTPFIALRVDSVTIVSTDMLALPDSVRARTPQWADTLLTLGSLEGSINPLALLSDRIELRDVALTRPAVNLYTVSESISNYHIYSSEPDTTASEISLPAISINRFSIVDPKPIRFANALTAQHFTVALTSMTLEGLNAPTYRLEFGGDLASPELGLYNLEGLEFGVNGHIGWEPSKPTEVELSNFALRAEFLEATVNARVDMGEDIIVRDFSLDLGRMSVEQILKVIPADIRNEYHLNPDHISTDLAFSFEAHSTAPFNLTTDSLPHADLAVHIDPGKLTYGRARFDRIGGTIAASLRGNDIDSAIFELRDFTIAGPATDLLLNISATEVTSDPLLKGSVKGSSILAKLPPELRRFIPGFISGNARADIAFEMRPSMLERNTFHRLRLRGNLDLDRLYFVSADTVDMLYAHHTNFRFGTNERHGTADSLLTASIAIDSANFLHSNASMSITGLSLGVGSSNKHRSADTTVVIPLGGALKIKKFGLEMLDQNFVLRIRDIEGHVAMDRYRNRARQPRYQASLDIGKLSTGDSTMRLLLRDMHLGATGHKLPLKERKVSKEIKHTADSLHLARPDIPMDSVYRFAIDRHRRNRHKYPRVHPEYTAEETEMIEWGTSSLLRKIFNEWDIRGRASARRAGFFAQYFPVRNRIRNFNLTFNTDSVNITDLKYKVGESDFLISGTISNMKRGFTSRGFRSPVKINFDVLSDTIDVNQIADALFRGAAWSDAHEKGLDKSHLNLEEIEDRDDDELERTLGSKIENAPDSMAPLLIPMNVDLRLNMRAHNLLYSDLVFNDFSGELLADRGALNLHDLRGRSDIGSVNMSALYSAPTPADLKFGFGLKVDRFNIARFMRLMPAIDSIMPIMNDFAGIIDADIAATCDIDRNMNLDLPSLNAAFNITGDSLEFIDPDTYRTIGKWLLFKDKQDNVIKHMNVAFTISDGIMHMYPFTFDVDRYRLGIQGTNDLNLNFDYHIAVFKSPIPFKFGINIKGNPDKYKIRLGRARFKEGQSADVAIVSDTRVNLLSQIETIFRRGVDNSRFARLNISSQPTAAAIDLSSDTISAADSLVFIREGLIPAPPVPDQPADKKKSKKKSKK